MGQIPTPSTLRTAYSRPGACRAAVNARRMYTPQTFSVQGPRRSVELTEREWELLSLLFEYRGTHLTRETILSRVWGPYYVNQSALLDETLTSLRAAMKRAGYPTK